MTSAISVVIPTFNRAEFVMAAVETVRRQSRPPLEILVVDDGSSDDTASVCRSLGERIRYLPQPNRGVSAARNYGAREANGDLIAFLDSDDTWHPDRLAVGAAALAQWPEVGWSVSNLDVIDLAGRLRPGVQGFEGVFPVFGAEQATPPDFFARALAREALTVESIRHEVFVGNAFELLFRGNFAHASTALIRRELFARSGGFDESLRVAEDTEFFHRFSADSPVAVVMTPLAAWRVGQTETLTSSKNITTIVENALLSLDRAARLRPISPETVLVLEQRRRQELRLLAFAHLTALEGAKARAALRRARVAGAKTDIRSLAILAASWVPSPMLRALHQLKRRMAG